MKGIKIENVVFFAENREIWIGRGRRIRMVIIDNQGRVMVRLKGYENYFLCVKTCEVFSRNGRGTVMKPLKKILRSGAAYYNLSISGFPKMISLEKILEENLKDIENYFAESKKVLKNFQVKGNEVSH